MPPELPTLVLKSGVSLGGLAAGERDVALALVAAVLPPGAAWSEAEVNQALRLCLTREAIFLSSDAAELRRWLVDTGFWRRDGFGRRYEPCPLEELSSERRALVTILEDEAGENPHECYLLSEESLAKDWNRPEEDKAWASFQ